MTKAVMQKRLAAALRELSDAREAIGKADMTRLEIAGMRAEIARARAAFNSAGAEIAPLSVMAEYVASEVKRLGLYRDEYLRLREALWDTMPSLPAPTVPMDPGEFVTLTIDTVRSLQRQRDAAVMRGAL